MTRDEPVRPEPHQFVPLWRRPLLAGVISPFVLSRVALLLIGWLSEYICPLSAFLPAETGRLYSTHRLLDIWGRWDTGWYMSIVTNGYRASDNLATVQSNVAFFPLYPYLVRLGLLLIPNRLESSGVILFTGVVISNLCFLFALTLIYRLVAHLGYGERTARRAVLYLTIFPVSFIFSSFYTESVFLVLAALVFYLLEKRRWQAACCVVGLASAARLPGILLAAPLAWAYMERLKWRIRDIRSSCLWLLVTPVGLLAFMARLYRLSGDPLAFIHNHAAWQRHFAPPWGFVVHVVNYPSIVDALNVAISLGFLVLAMLVLLTPRLRLYGIFSLLNLSSFLFSGTPMSAMRFCMVTFPAFVILAELGESVVIHTVITVGSIALLGVLMVMWSQGYWVV